MEANSAYLIGHDHIVCQDYTIAGGDDNLSYAILCDGCSASPQVDIGARLVALSAQHILHEYEISKEASTATAFGARVCRNLIDITCKIPYLHPQAIDATLLVSWVKDGMATTYIYGDGVFVLRKKSGNVQAVHVDISSGCPDYLSYWISPTRKQTYAAIEDNIKNIDTLDLSEGITIKSTKLPFEPYAISYPVDEGDVISLMSDGINTFKQSDNTPIPWTDMINEFTDYKLPKGEFALRRLSALKRKCIKEAIRYSDDISVASIVI